MTVNHCQSTGYHKLHAHRCACLLSHGHLGDSQITKSCSHAWLSIKSKVCIDATIEGWGRGVTFQSLGKLLVPPKIYAGMFKTCNSCGGVRSKLRDSCITMSTVQGRRHVSTRSRSRMAQRQCNQITNNVDTFNVSGRGLALLAAQRTQLLKQVP